MNDEFNRTADWEPGTLDKTRRNIGDIDAMEAAEMTKKLGGQILYEKSSSDSSIPSGSGGKSGRIVRNEPAAANGSGGGKTGGNSSESKTASSGNGSSSSGAIGFTPPKKRTHEDLPEIPKKINAAIDKLMMSTEYKIKPNYGVFNFIRTLQKNGTERILPEFYQYKLKKDIEHIETFITAIKTLIQIAPATYKAKIVGGTEPKFKFLRMIANWSVQAIKFEYAGIQALQNPALTSDLIPFVRAIYTPLITVYYYGSNKIPKLIKEIYADEAAYPDSPQDKISAMAKQAITEWLHIDTEIIKKLYPLLMRMCSDTFESYPEFFSVKVAEILKFTGLHKFDLLLPEKEKTPEKEEVKPKTVTPQKGVKDATVITGLKLLEQLFPKAGFDHLEEHPDLYAYFQPLYKFDEGFALLSPENPVQFIAVMQRIIEDCIQGCRNIKFTAPNDKNATDTIYAILDEWTGYREDNLDHLYYELLTELANSVYSQPDYERSRIGKRQITSLLWQTTYHFMPNFKFDQLVLERPTDESKYRPMFHRTDFARKFITECVTECDSQAKTRGTVSSIENPWDHYDFGITNEVSKRLDVLLGAQNKTANTNANNANLLKYTLCLIAVLDWWINNPGSPAYSTDPMKIYRVSLSDGKPVFSVPTRSDQNSLFKEAVQARYQKSAR